MCILIFIKLSTVCLELQRDDIFVLFRFNSAKIILKKKKKKKRKKLNKMLRGKVVELIFVRILILCQHRLCVGTSKTRENVHSNIGIQTH
jgi:hypothetical protein